MYKFTYIKGGYFMKAMIEICCGSYQDALAAWKGGAKRIELNSALALGGKDLSDSLRNYGDSIKGKSIRSFR